MSIEEISNWEDVECLLWDELRMILVSSKWQKDCLKLIHQFLDNLFLILYLFQTYVSKSWTRNVT